MLKEMEQTLTEWANILSVTLSDKEKTELSVLLRNYDGKHGIVLSSALASDWASQMRSMVVDIQRMLRQRR